MTDQDASMIASFVALFVLGTGAGVIFGRLACVAILLAGTVAFVWLGWLR